MNVTSRPSGRDRAALVPVRDPPGRVLAAWSRARTRSRRRPTSAGGPPAGTTCDVSRYGLFDSMLRTSRPSARRRTALVSDGGPMSSGIGTTRHGVHVRPASGESASRTAIGRQPSVSGLNSGWPGNASRSIHSAGDDQVVAVEPGDRSRLERARAGRRASSRTASPARSRSARRRSSAAARCRGRRCPCRCRCCSVTSRLPSARTTNAGNVANARGVPGTAAETTARSTTSMTAPRDRVRPGRSAGGPPRRSPRTASRPRRPRPPPGRPRRGAPAAASKPACTPRANCCVCSANASSRIGL